jgi:hypothetical protein
MLDGMRVAGLEGCSTTQLRKSNTDLRRADAGGGTIGANRRQIFCDPRDFILSTRNDVTVSTDRSSSSDLDLVSGRSLVIVESEAPAGSRLRNIVFITASITATLGWLWFLFDAAEWLIGV